MWKIQTPPPLVKVVYIWNVDFFDFGFDPPPLMDFFHNLWDFFWIAPLSAAQHYTVQLYSQVVASCRQRTQM